MVVLHLDECRDRCRVRDHEVLRLLNCLLDARDLPRFFQVQDVTGPQSAVKRASSRRAAGDLTHELLVLVLVHVCRRVRRHPVHIPRPNSSLGRPVRLGRLLHLLPSLLSPRCVLRCVGSVRVQQHCALEHGRGELVVLLRALLPLRLSRREGVGLPVNIRKENRCLLANVGGIRLTSAGYPSR